MIERKSLPWIGGALALVVAGVIVTVVLVSSHERRVATPTEITLQLPWLHTGAFAGYYAADQNGDYAAEGLAVIFREGAGSIDPVDAVLNGDAQFGIASANHLLKARADGKPVRVVAVMHQLNPVLYVTLKGSGITRPERFAGKTINTSATNEPVLHALARHFGIEPDLYRVTNLYPKQIDRFLSGEIDVWTGFHFSTKRRLEEFGVDANFIYPDDYGVHFYRDSLFTTDDFLRENPEIAAAFLRATLIEGWTYAFENPDAAAAMTARYKPDANIETETDFLVAMMPLIKPNRSPIGSMNPEHWQEMTRMLTGSGVLAETIDPADIYTMELLSSVYGQAE